MAHRGHLYERHSGAQRLGDSQKRSGGGGSPDNPVGRRHIPRALSHPVISFELRTRGWLAEAITGLLDQEALEESKGTIGKVRGRSPDHPVGPRPVPGPCLVL